MVKGIGILLYSVAGCRILGDPGFPGTFDFPVVYGVVEGSYRDLVTGSEDACKRLCRAAKELENRGVLAIAGDCGLMALYQEEIAQSVSVPVVSSALVLLPFIRSVISGDRFVGVLTGHSGILGKNHMEGAGAADLKRVVVQGMQEEPHFQKVVIEGSSLQEYNRMKEDVLNGVEKLREQCDDLGAVLLECSNLAVFGREITKEFSVPVFDINSGIMMLWESVNKNFYEEENICVS